MKTGKLYPQGSFNANSWVKIYDHTVTGSAVTSLTISGLNGNLLTNSDFETWTAGVNAAPDGWEYNGGGVGSVARSSENPTPKIGTYSASLTRAGTDCYLRNNDYLTPAKGLAYWKGRTVTFGCWVYATVADRARIWLVSKVDTQSSSSFHTGNSTWQWLTVTQTVSATADQLTFQPYIETGNTTAYFDGAMCVEGSTVPQTTSSNIGLYCLNGNTAGKFLLKARVVNGRNGSSNYLVRPNNDSGANYGYQLLYGVDTSVGAIRATTETGLALNQGIGAIAKIAQSKITIHAKSGYVRTAISESTEGISGTSVLELDSTGHSWNNTVDNITSLVVLADQTGGLGVGTNITLWQPQWSA